MVGGSGVRGQAYFPFSIFQHFPAIIFPEKRESKVNSTIIIYRIPAFLFAYFLGNFPYKFSPIFILFSAFKSCVVFSTRFYF